MPDPTSRILVPVIAETLINLEHMVLILAAMHENRKDPTSVELLIIEALGYIERSKRTLNLEVSEMA